MHSGDITRDQAVQLHEKLRPMFSYLAELQMRLDDREFSKADRFYHEVAAARYAMQLLVDHVHRMSTVGYVNDKQ
jgi:hypothetical protein